MGEADLINCSLQESRTRSVLRRQPPADHAFVKTPGPKAAAAARIGAALGRRKRAELLELLRPCFARTEPWLQAGKYAAAVMCDLRRRNGWTIAERAGDRTPDRTQRLLNRAVWDTWAAMGVVRRFAVAGLDEAARKTGRRRGLAVGAIDETGQVKAGTRTAGVKRQYLGCAGKVANGINTVHLSYVREGAGHALAGAREWIPAAHIGDPVTSAVMGLPADLVFRTKGQLAIDILAEAFADGVRLDFVCGDEVYGSCTGLREYLEDRDQAYVLRVPCIFSLAMPGGLTLTCQQAAARLGRRGWEVRSAGTGSKGQRWYAWAWLGTASARHHLLIRRHLTTGELAYHYCYLPEGQPASPARPVRAAGLRWPCEEDFEFGKDCFGLDQSQVRLYTAIARHTVLVMAALAICAVTAALLRRRTGTQAPAPVLPDQPPPADPGMIPLTVPETGRLLGHPPPPVSTGHWLDWRRRHQACSRWYHQRTRLARHVEIALVR
jgi:SRSO17 transposase